MLRELRPDDVPYLYDITMRSLDETFSPEIFTYFGMHWPSGQIVACNPVGVPVGFLFSMKQEGSARIMMFAVAPEYRGRGIGRRMLSAFRTKAMMEGLRKIVLEVRDTNTGAIDFYKKNGFTVFGVQENFYNDGGNALTMVSPVQLNI